MTTGEPLRLLLAFAVPLLIGNLFQQAYNLADSIIVGRYVGKVALGAVGSTGSIMFFINSMTIGMSVGIGIVVAQFFGAKEDKKVKNTIGNAFYIVIVTAMIMAIIGFTFAGTILKLLDTPDTTFVYAVVYLRTTSVGFIAMASFNLLSSILRALGDSKTPLRFLIVACIINICLDLLFVIKFNLGVMGVGIATATAQFIAAVLCLIYAIRSNTYFRLKISDFKFNFSIFVKVLKVGIPVSGQSSLIAFSLIALQKVVNGFGDDFVTSFTVVSRIEQLVQQPFMSLGAALATYTGQNIGAGRIDRVKQGFIKATLCSTIFAGFIFIIFQTFAPQIVRIFGDDPIVENYAVTGLRITCSFYVFLGLIYTTRNVLNGAGDANFSLFTGIVECIGRVGFARPLTMVQAIGLNGVWLTTGITWLLNGVFSTIRYKRGKWKTTAIVRAKENNSDVKVKL
ncbi:MAG: MATE family efflux transporter [Lachnospiraceae bacterium]|nr:MATE family efflux transporter [Lachnospiraceae bacterium]